MGTTQEATRTAPKSGSRAGLIVVGIFATLIALVALGTYASGSLTSLGEGENTIAAVFAKTSALMQAAFYAHIVGGAVALVLGPFQFSTRLRARFTRAHRVTGRIYLTAVWIAATAGLVIAPDNSAGVIGVAGFGSLGVLWFVTSVLAYRAARSRRLDDHRAWMIRNYALTFAAVTLRLWLPLLIGIYAAATGAGTTESFEWAYAIVPILCWVPNLLVAEWLVRRRGLPPLALPRRRAT